MSDRFEWHGEDENGSGRQPHTSQGRGSLAPFWFWAGVTAVILLAWGGWRVGQGRLAQAEIDQRQAVQAILDLEHEAFLVGDGELFFSVYDQDPAWRMAQRHPYHQAVHRAGLRATRVQQVNDYLWANVSWTADERTWQRITFFHQTPEQLTHVAADPAYWGDRRQETHPWGTLVFYEVDAAWASAVAQFVTQVVAEVCAVTCLDGRSPFTLVLTADHQQTAIPDQLHLPSPRLLALDENGAPAPLFWQQLRRQLVAHLTPATIRFAVPPTAAEWLNYEQAAADFMLAHPDITVEIDFLATLPDDPAELVAYDAVAMTPTASMLAQGLVYDLTDFVQSDPAFNSTDFYEQMWQGAWWQDRMWLMPQTGIMRLLFYDRAAYQRAGLDEPSLRWTWAEMAADVARLVANQPVVGDLAWGFMDTGNDALLSYAYNWNNNCTEPATVRCARPLPPENIAAALEWYQRIAGQSGQMPDLTMLNSAEREQLMTNWLSSRRRVAVWVESPADYEHRLLMAPMGVVPLPGSDRFDGITPLWVQGTFISQATERPLATWQWLKFLSYQPPWPRLRLIPARPSVANQTRYWELLPRPLGDAMRIAFPFARPVTIEEQALFSREQLAAVISGELSPEAAVRQQPPLIWFSKTGIPERNASSNSD